MSADRTSAPRAGTSSRPVAVGPVVLIITPRPGGASTGEVLSIKRRVPGGSLGREWVPSPFLVCGSSEVYFNSSGSWPGKGVEMFRIFKFKTTVVSDLKLSVYVSCVSVPAEEYKGIVNEVLLLSDEDPGGTAQPEARLRIARRDLEKGTVQIFEVGARAGVEVPEENWPTLRKAVASFALVRMGQLMASAGITLPAVIIGEEQEISDRTAAMLLGLPAPPSEGGR